MNRSGFLGITALVAGLLLAAASVSMQQLARASAQAQRAGQQHESVLTSLDAIRSLQGRPELASVDEDRSTLLARRIETTAADAGIAAQQIERIQTQPPRRIDSGPYLRQPTQVLLRQTTLPQLVTLLHDLDPEGQTLQLDEVRLIAPHDQLVGDRWRAEFTLSYLVYDPLPSRNESSP